MTVSILPAPRLEDVAARLRQAVSPLALVLVPACAQLLIAFFFSSTPSPHLSALPPPAALFDSKSLPPGSPDRSWASPTPATSRSSQEHHHVELLPRGLDAMRAPAPVMRTRYVQTATFQGKLAQASWPSWRAPPSRALREVSGQVRDAAWYKFLSIFDSAVKQGRRVTTSSVMQTARGALHQGSGPCPSDSQPTWLCIAPASHAASVALTIPTPRLQSPTSRRKLRLRYDTLPIVSKPSRWTWDGALRISFTLGYVTLGYTKHYIEASGYIGACHYEVSGHYTPLQQHYVVRPALRNQAGYYRHYGTTAKSGFADGVKKSQGMIMGNSGSGPHGAEQNLPTSDHDLPILRLDEDDDPCLSERPETPNLSHPSSNVWTQTSPAATSPHPFTEKKRGEIEPRRENDLNNNSKFQTQAPLNAIKREGENAMRVNPGISLHLPATGGIGGEGLCCRPYLWLKAFYLEIGVL
ncbi:hypothetical protein DFH09DRAFT_1098113 [Mycena vulgaris]|nr:hypothetical protein DFH09DRAFT_1098113 [Mycena vulgaris]